MEANMSDKTPELQYYFDFLSQPSRALYILLKASGRTFGAYNIDLLEGENTTEEFRTQINRFQRVPAIIDGDFKLAESIAILRYLQSKEYISERFYPADICQRARIDEFLEWQHTAIRSSCSLYFRFLWVEQRFFGAPAAAGKVAKYKREMERDLQLLEHLWLKDTPFLTGSQMTAADVFGACEVEQIKITGYNVGEKFAKVANWIAAVSLALEPHFELAHQKVYKFEAETKAKLSCQ